jgi:Domain of unknown function (DUF4160)
MPTVLSDEGFRIMVFPKDHPPAHVHVFKAGAMFQVDLRSFKASEVKGNISKADIRRACRLVFENAAVLRKEWENIHGEI